MLAQVDLAPTSQREFVLAGENHQITTLHAHFGKWLRTYPKDILRGMSEVCNWLREHEVYILHAIADEGIDGSDTLLKWLGAKPTGHIGDVGPWYRLDLRECKI